MVSGKLYKNNYDVHKRIENLKKKILELKDTVTELRNSTETFNFRLEQDEESMRQIN